MYTPEQDRSGDGGDEEEDTNRNTVLSFQLNTLLECLNIFGTATGPVSGGLSGPRQSWRRTGDTDEEEGGDQRQGGQRRRKTPDNNGKIDNFFSRADGKGTGMRISYAGEGYPLVVLL